MTYLPIEPVVLPDDLKNQQNGKLDDELMVEIAGGSRLHHLAARAWNALVAEAAKQGLPLTYTFGGCYRTYAQQERLFLQRYTTHNLPGRPTKRWNGTTYWLKPGMAGAAVPGTSNHGLGLAVDTASGASPREAKAIGAHPQFKWLVENAHLWGWSWEDVSENWHLRYVAGDAIPQAVLNFENPFTPPPIHEGDDFDMKIVNPPARVYDSRKSGGAFASGESRRIKVSNADAVFVNITAVPQSGGFLTAWGSGARPDVSNLNFSDTPIANTSWIPCDDGHINVYSYGATDVIIDVQATS